MTPDARTAGVVSDAESAIRDLGSAARPALAPLGRLLLRTESIASSRVEGIQLGVLAGKWSLSINQIRALHRELGIPVELLLG